MTIPTTRTAPLPSYKSEGEAFPDAAHRPSSRDLPSLDGLRAVSVCFVILGHWAVGHTTLALETLFGHLANFGVFVFFVISGYLITTLLWREAEKRGGVNLRRFYLRRTLRIFPPFYAYLAIVALAALGGILSIPSETRWWPALTYLSNFFSTNNLLTRHSWSLSLEEQYYLSWPIVLATYIRRRSAISDAPSVSPIAVAALVAFPVTLRIVIFGVTRIGWLTGQFIFDYVAAGSALALFESAVRWDRGRRILNSLLRSKFTPVVALLALAMHLRFTGTTRWQFAADMVVLTPTKAALLAIFVVWTVRNPQHLIGRALNWKPMRVIGIGSYSLYLWQQLFFAPGASFPFAWSAQVKLLALAACAMASYRIVEVPCLRLRSRVERKLFREAI
jgi:peptidoglycan/LPS O-acetylase OafA/YrhL